MIHFKDLQYSDDNSGEYELHFYFTEGISYDDLDELIRRYKVASGLRMSQSFVRELKRAEFTLNTSNDCYAVVWNYTGANELREYV